ncbi:hypothetical protein [Gordonia mangrovi]|uniref:hypothetical protein n=1 Tax=Gordonia mangrovi TaxID=2665643 RepID=UPI0021AC8DD1|nr:hypothetical protein [Gordonia mangrovi]UVF78320.1 hypothetical protein NWF22_00010 [Gordonia mangrovi]
MYPRLASLTVAAALLIGLTGCGSDDPSADSATSAAVSDGCAQESTSGLDGVNLLPIPPATVTVIDAGGGEKRLPAAAPDRADAQTVTLTTTSSVRSPGSDESQTVEMPLRALFHCTDSTDLEMTLGDVTSPDAVLADQLTAVAGSRAGLAIGPGTMPISLRLLPAEEAGPEARLAVEQTLVQALQLSVPVPTEPIGIGARWRSERTIDSAVTVTQQIDATLTGWAGDRMTVDVTVEETPVNSVFAIPGSGGSLTIARFSNAGAGELTIDLTRGLPASGSIELSGARELVGADPTQPLIQQTGLSVRWQ